MLPCCFCAEFGQVGDVGAWYVGGAATLTPVPLDAAATTFEDCVAKCKAEGACEYVTYDYKTNDLAKKCFLKMNTPADQAYAGIG